MSPLLTRFLLILTAVILDWFLQEKLPFTHPVELIGMLITRLEKFLSEKFQRSFKTGFILTAAVLLISVGFTYTILQLLHMLHPLAAAVLALYIYYSGLAAGSLSASGRNVAKKIAEGKLQEARDEVNMLITRDVEKMGAEDLSRAGIETVAENMNDAVIAPLLFAFVFGPEGMIAYKTIDTLDSMVGYKNEEYRKMGWASARLDDIASWLPARITAGCLIFAALLPGFSARSSLSTVRSDARKTSSPNAGYPEAAVAGALKVRLGGPDYYFGEEVDKPYLGKHHKPCSFIALKKAVKLIYISEILFLVAAGFIFRFLAVTPIFSLLGG